MTARRRLHADVTYRSCSRCGQELTDPASRECGVGPVCRKRDNHLYAKLISANLPMAAALLYGTHPEELSEELEGRFIRLCKTFTEKAQVVQSGNDDAWNMNLTGADFREEVRELDYFLSFKTSYETRNKLIGVVRHLGYVGLAAVLSGEASKSNSKVWFENGRVYLQGTGCTPGWRKMKNIPGITTPKYRGEKAPYSAPAAYAGAFLAVIIEHWPLYDADLNEIQIQAQQWITDNPKLVANEEKTINSLASITHRSHDFVLSFPWSNEHDTRGMIAKLKGIPSSERSYHGATKNWLFKPAQLDRVLNIVNEHFGDCPVSHSAEPTPKEQWVKHNPYPNRRRSRHRGYWY